MVITHPYRETGGASLSNGGRETGQEEGQMGVKPAHLRRQEKGQEEPEFTLQEKCSQHQLPALGGYIRHSPFCSASRGSLGVPKLDMGEATQPSTLPPRLSLAMGNQGHSPADRASAQSGTGRDPAASFLNPRQP